MKTKSLRYIEELGAYYAREDGNIVDSNGKVQQVYFDGTVRLIDDRGIAIRIGAHKLVAICFVPNPNDWDFVKFKDGNKKNRLPENLYWVASKSGGKRLTVHKPTAEGILELHGQGVGIRQIVDQLGVSKSYAYKVIQRAQANNSIQASQ